MELLSIGVAEGKDKVLNTICDYDFLYDIEIKEEKIGNRLFIKIITEDKNTVKNDNSLCIILSLLITEIIMKYYIKDIIYKKVFIKYNDLYKEEKIEIGKIAFKSIIKDNSLENEKKLIFNEVKKYINKNDEIIIDGFVNFRLNALDSSLDTLIEKSKEKYYEEKEYKEFIKILKYFVDIQEPKMDLVNIVIQENNYKLYDQNNQFIENDFFNEVINELSIEGITKEDLLISSIITIAPKNIVIHGSEKHRKDDLIKILESVFEEKVTYCTGCKLCSLQMPINKEK